jgi:hypothetical protein
MDTFFSNYYLHAYLSVFWIGYKNSITTERIRKKQEKFPSAKCPNFLGSSPSLVYNLNRGGGGGIYSAAQRPESEFTT